MCQKNPGPRCSSDAKKKITETSQKFHNYLKENDIDRDYGYLEDDEAAELRDAFNKACLMFQTTPEGKKELEGEISFAIFNNSIVSADNALNLFEKPVLIPKERILRAELSNSVWHRKWQERTLKTLESTPAARVPLYAEAEISLWEKSNEENQKAVDKSSKTLQDFMSKERPHDEKVITDAYLTRRKCLNMIQYNEMKISALKDYVAGKADNTHSEK